MKKLCITILLATLTLSLIACGTDKVKAGIDKVKNTITEETSEGEDSVTESSNKSDSKKVNLDLEKFKSDNSIELEAVDVQYDMANNLDKEFAVRGTARLVDYYNYKYSDSQDQYFAVDLEPLGDDAGEYWTMYCDKDDFKDLYETLKCGETEIIMSAVVPSSKFESGMDSLATAKKASYQKKKYDPKTVNSKELNSFIKEQKIEVDGVEMAFNKGDYIDKSFAIEGKARLDDYYNYDYDGVEASHFSVAIECANYIDWNVYFDREENKELFEALKKGEKNIIVKAIVPADKYDKDMGNLATGEAFKIK